MPSKDMREANADSQAGWAHDRVPTNDLRGDADAAVLQRRLEKAEQKAQKLMAQKDELRDKLRAATEDAAQAQRALLDARVAEAQNTG